MASDDWYLVARLELLRDRVRRAIELFRAHDPGSLNDRFRGLFVSDDRAATLLDDRPFMGPNGTDATSLDELEHRADEAEKSGDVIRPRELARSFGIDRLDVELVLIAVAPDLDPRLEPAYGYLHDDVTRRRASIGLCLELVGCPPTDGIARQRFDKLAKLGLIRIESTDRPFLTRSVSVPDDVVAFLLGAHALDPLVAELVVPALVTPELDTDMLARAFKNDVRLFYVRDAIGSASLSFVATAAQAAGRSLLPIDLSRLAPSADIDAVLAAAVRSARLYGGVLCVTPLDAITERGPGPIRTLAESGATVVAIGTGVWDPSWCRMPPLVLDAPIHRAPLADSLAFRLTPEQALRATQAAHIAADARGEDVTTADLADGARSQNAGGLERLALRVRPAVGWDDVILPATTRMQLDEVVARVRHRDTVLGDWGLQRGGARGRGVTALFSGESGTGKTLSAEVVAGELGLDLYVIDLATVIDKYIGETEKNLERIFREADRVNGVLLFDEADAIFGKRSEVSDAKDRYANVEVAYLLQRMERFDGVAILTTNLRANVDEAFLRRLDALVDFPTPDADGRLLLWRNHLPSTVPVDDDVDLAFIARQFELSGGNIKSIAVSSAYLAASAGRAVSMADLIRSTGREYRKLGRLLVASEFGPYHALLRDP
jgi:ATPase family associated with various cellular activities (AAA)